MKYSVFNLILSAVLIKVLLIKKFMMILKKEFAGYNHWFHWSVLKKLCIKLPQSIMSNAARHKIAKD